MRILVLTLDALDGIGGIQRFNARLLRALDELVEEGLVEEVVSLSLWDAPGTRGPGAVRHLGFGRSKPAFVRGFASALLRHRPQVVLWGHVLLLRLLPAARLLAPRARHLLVVHGVEVWGDPRYRRIPAFERPLARRVQRIASVSRTTAERMAAAYGIPPHRFVLLPNAVDPTRDGAPARERHEGRLRILSVTRLSPKEGYKGVDLVLRAVAALEDRLPAEYVVVGDGELRRQYEALARSLGLERVRFVGRVSDEDLERWYRWAEVFVLPSTGEGFGIVYLEAWNHGLPVVAAAAGGAAEVVEDERTGILVPPGSAEAVAEAIWRLGRDPDLRARLGSSGRAAVEARYSHERFRRRLAEILASLGEG